MYKALVSFAGHISMVKGEVRDIDDPEIVSDLLKAGYIVDLEAKKKAAKASRKSKNNNMEGGASYE